VILEDPSPAGFNLSIISAGLIMLPAAIVSMAFAPLSAMITRKKGPKITILIGTTVLFISYIGLYFYRASPLDLLEDATLVGVGLSFIFVGVIKINILLVSTPRSESGASTSMNVVFRNIGSAIAPAVSGVFETMYVTNIVFRTPLGNITRAFPSYQAFSYIYLTGMAFLAISVVFTFLMKNAVYKKPLIEILPNTEKNVQ
jgi:MFS family permease